MRFNLAGLFKPLKKDYEISGDRAEMRIPHLEGKITFMRPVKGPGNYAGVQEAINSAGLIAPTMAQTASLVYTANQNPNEVEFGEVLDILDTRWFWVFVGKRYVKNKGVYIRDNPAIVNGRLDLENESELQNKIEAGDKSVRFVPFGFKIGEQKASDLARNSYLIGLAGKEGAEKLAEISGRYNLKPKVWSLENVDKDEIGMSSLGGCYCEGSRLGVGSGCFYDQDGCAFGVCRTNDKGTNSLKN